MARTSIGNSIVDVDLLLSLLPSPNLTQSIDRRVWTSLVAGKHRWRR